MDARIYELLMQIGDENRSKVGNLISDFMLESSDGCAIFRWSNHEHGYAQGFVKITTLPEWAKKVLAAGVMYASEERADAWVDYD